MKPVPIPAKYPYLYAGSWVLKGWGQGQPKMTLGLPMLITTNIHSKSTSSLIAMKVPSVAEPFKLKYQLMPLRPPNVQLSTGMDPYVQRDEKM